MPSLAFPIRTERLALRREAELRHDYWCKGEYTDTAIYGMLDADPR